MPKNTSDALRRRGVCFWAVSLCSRVINPSACAPCSSRGVAQDGRRALAADRASRRLPPQPGKNPAPGDGWEQAGWGSMWDMGSRGVPVPIAAPGVQLACHRDADLGNLPI